MPNAAVTDNLNVVGFDDMPPPAQIKQELPLSDAGAETVHRGRAQLTRILDRQDPRLFVVVGPCSIHDPRAALE
jgi:3-deoxy-7-phosphoheptulonate synthase